MPQSRQDQHTAHQYTANKCSHMSQIYNSYPPQDIVNKQQLVMWCWSIWCYLFCWELIT